MRGLLRVSVVGTLFLVGWVFVAAGCTKEEKLYRVSGKVTFDGKPIPKGNIFFDPQVDGPQGYGSILDGTYDTAKAGRGVRGGQYNIRVNGFDGKEANEAPFGQALFLEYNGTKELPAEDSKFDLEIPKKR